MKPLFTKTSTINAKALFSPQKKKLKRKALFRKKDQAGDQSNKGAAGDKVLPLELRGLEAVAEKAKGLTSTTSTSTTSSRSSSTSESSLKPWKSASKSSSTTSMSSDLACLLDCCFLPPDDDRFRSGHRKPAVNLQDLGLGMKSEMMAPPHIARTGGTVRKKKIRREPEGRGARRRRSELPACESAAGCEIGRSI